MARVKYPFIVCYSGPEKDLFAKEPDPDNPADDFQQVEDQLLATVYHNIKEFKAGFGRSPTEWVERQNQNPWADGHIVALIYVG
jgi:hypothetical protein